MNAGPTLSIRRASTSRRVQMYRIVKFVISRMLSAFQAYHKSPSIIASDKRTKAITGRGALASKRPAINRNVSNYLEPDCRAILGMQTRTSAAVRALPQFSRMTPDCIIIRSARSLLTLI